MTMRYFQQALVSALLIGGIGTAAAQSDSTGDGKGSLSATDTVFIENAAQGGMAEIQMGKTAVGKSTDDKVKALAQRIVDDHTKVDAALKTLAVSKKVSFPSGPAKDAQKENDKLQSMKGSGFDEAWAKAMVKDHQDAIKMFTQEGKDTKDTDIQQFVKSNLPTLKSHLEAAQQLAAVSDARDQAMDQSTKSISTIMDSTPAATSTAPTPTPTTVKAAVTPATTTATSSAKH